MTKVSHFSHLLPEDDIVCENVWKIYQMIRSEVQSDYAGKFDVSAANKQWAVAADSVVKDSLIPANAE